MQSPGRFYLVFVTALLLLSNSLPTLAQSCNGASSLCSKKYSEVHYATAHNAFSVGQIISANQHNSITKQLDDGVRALMLDAHMSPNVTGQIQLCHASCTLQDAGPLIPTLQAISKWMVANPNEVVTILWENYGKIAPSVFDEAYKTSGIAPLVFTQTPSGSQDWPTLQEMITAGTRLVNFIDTGADSTVTWLMPEYTYVWETPFEIPASEPQTFTCTLDRPKIDASAAPAMYVMNHFVGKLLSGYAYIPQPGTAASINSYDTLMAHITNCGTLWGTTPNFIAVDFYEAGDVLKVVAELNGVQYVPKASSSATSTSRIVINNSGASNCRGEIMLVGSALMALLLGIIML